MFLSIRHLKSTRPLLVPVALRLPAPVLEMSTDETDYGAVLRAVDRSRSFDATDFSAVFTVASEKPDEQTRVFKARMARWR